MKHETTSSAAGEEGGGTAAMQPLPVSDELISRLAGRCEEIFPLNDRLRHDEISDEEIHEMESLLKRLRPAPVRVLFREQCCSLMCAESEQEMGLPIFQAFPWRLRWAPFCWFKIRW